MTKAASGAHTPVKRRHPTIHTASAHARRAPAAAIAPAESRASAVTVPTFDDIPRQVTPEGNVLRVKGGQMPAQVER